MLADRFDLGNASHYSIQLKRQGSDRAVPTLSGISTLRLAYILRGVSSVTLNSAPKRAICSDCPAAVTRMTFSRRESE
jgi:hypothetical protein